jgi:hypothetical protein
MPLEHSCKLIRAVTGKEHLVAAGQLFDDDLSPCSTAPRKVRLMGTLDRIDTRSEQHQVDGIGSQFIRKNGPSDAA